jgi:ADP-ribose pyrophosphatase YjhB (NUDIX family)
MGKRVEIIARGVCVINGHVLLCHTKSAENTYLPGGHVEFEESARTALEREINEEMGKDAVARRFLGVCEHTFIQKDKRHCEMNLVFEMDIPGLELAPTPSSLEDYIEFLWVRLENLRAAQLEPAPLCDLLASWLDASFSEERFASTFVRDDEAL